MGDRPIYRDQRDTLERAARRSHPAFEPSDPPGGYPPSVTPGAGSSHFSPPPRARNESRLGTLKVIGAFVLGVATTSASAGYAAARFMGQLATKDDVAALVAGQKRVIDDLDNKVASASQSANTCNARLDDHLATERRR